MPTPYTGEFFEPRRGLRRVEQRVWRCLDSCLAKTGLEDVRLPVPVEEWIEGVFDIHFGIADLSHLGPDVLGAAFIREREILISETTLENEGRFRFTCAHELGHFVLHSRVSEVFRETESGDPAIATRYERQADRFAAAFLMPGRLFEQELFRICEATRLDPDQAYSGAFFLCCS